MPRTSMTQTCPDEHGDSIFNSSDSLYTSIISYGSAKILPCMSPKNCARTPESNTEKIILIIIIKSGVDWHKSPFDDNAAINFYVVIETFAEE